MLNASWLERTWDHRLEGLGHRSDAQLRLRQFQWLDLRFLQQQRVHVRHADHGILVVEPQIFVFSAFCQPLVKNKGDILLYIHFDQAKYILANALAVGAKVIDPGGELQTLVDSRREEFAQGTLVYNFRVSEYQTYYVTQNIDGTPLLVHNARCGVGANSTNNGSLKAKSGDLEEAARKAREFNPKPGKSVAPSGNPAGSYRPSTPLPRGPNGELIPSSPYPHTQLGTEVGRKVGPYTAAREFGPNGQPIRDIHFTVHGRLNIPGHMIPHQHRHIQMPTGGTPQFGPAEPFTW